MKGIDNSILWKIVKATAPAPRKSFVFVILTTILCGLIYTLVMTGICQVLFNDKANGSIIEVNGVK